MSKATKAVMEASLPAGIKEAIEAIAKGLGVAAVELWSIFVRQYVVKGLTELFTAVVLIAVGAFLATQVGYWSLIAFGAALPFCYGSIMLLGNPKYYALEDITKKIKEIK